MKKKTNNIKGIMVGAAGFEPAAIQHIYLILIVLLCITEYLLNLPDIIKFLFTFFGRRESNPRPSTSLVSFLLFDHTLTILVIFKLYKNFLLQSKQLKGGCYA
jgi:hypothetical protein